MITGDHPATAAAVAEAIGMLRPGDRVVTGAELPALADGDRRRMRVYRPYRSGAEARASSSGGAATARWSR